MAFSTTLELYLLTALVSCLCIVCYSVSRHMNAQHSSPTATPSSKQRQRHKRSNKGRKPRSRNHSTSQESEEQSHPSAEAEGKSCPLTKAQLRRAQRKSAKMRKLKLQLDFSCLVENDVIRREEDEQKHEPAMDRHDVESPKSSISKSASESSSDEAVENISDGTEVSSSTSTSGNTTVALGDECGEKTVLASSLADAEALKRNVEAGDRGCRFGGWTLVVNARSRRKAQSSA